MRSRKRDHIGPILHHLHWLPVEKRIIYHGSPCSTIAISFAINNATWSAEKNTVGVTVDC